MKKKICLFLVSALAMSACHPVKTSNGQAGSADNSTQVVDTSKMHVAAPVADTSVKDGQVIKRYADGVIKEKSYYVKGLRQGECQSFYENGKLWSDDYFTNGVPDGPTASYYDNGEKRFDGAYTKGKPSGTWNFFDEKGKPVRTINYGKKGDKTIM